MNVYGEKPKITDKNMLVHKIVKYADKDICISKYLGYHYKTNILERNSIKFDNDVTVSGFHSYTNVKPKIGSIHWKEYEIGNGLIQCVGTSGSIYDAEFIIPKGSLFIVNKHGEIVSNQIKYTGKFNQL